MLEHDDESIWQLGRAWRESNGGRLIQVAAQGVWKGSMRFPGVVGPLHPSMPQDGSYRFERAGALSMMTAIGIAIAVPTRTTDQALSSRDASTRIFSAS